MNKDEVLERFRTWQESQGDCAARGVEWNVGAYRDVAVLVPARGHRSSELFLVADDRIVPYSPVLTDIERAYEELVTGSDDCAIAA